MKRQFKYIKRITKPKSVEAITMKHCQATLAEIVIIKQLRES